MTTTLATSLSAPAAYTAATSLAAGLYDLTGTVYPTGTNKPLDVLFEYAATVAANSSGNKQISLYVQGSMDGTNWGPVPTSTSDTTHDTSLKPLGVIQTNGGASSEPVRTPAPLSIATALGYLPLYFRVYIKNDCGVALSSCSARTQELTLTAA
jgi:hypothetical protein